MDNNILPPDSPVIYDGSKWVNMNNFLYEVGDDSPSSTDYFYVTFKSQYLNRMTYGNYNLFSLAVYVMGDVIFLRDFNDYGVVESGAAVFIHDIPLIIQNHSYFKDLSLNDIYYIGDVESHKELTRKIQNLVKDNSERPLSFYNWF